MISTPHSERDPLYFHSEPTPVPIFQREHEFRWLLQIYRLRNPMRICEVGSFHGGTLFHWLTNAQPGARVVTIDSYTAGVDNRSLFHEWRPPAVELVIISGDSRDPRVLRMAREQSPFDFLFIDAGHLQDEVQSDWDNYRPMVVPGGIVAFHDIMPSSHDWIQVSPVWEAIQHQGFVTQELVCDPAIGDWSGIGICYL